MLARHAGLAVDKGIIVDNFMTTSHPDVLAAGDVAEHNGITYGVWGASQYQGAIAGINAAGGRVAFGGLPRSNTLKVLGLDLLSIGQFEPTDGSYTVIDHEASELYARFVFRDNALVGAVLVGPNHAGNAVRKAVETRADMSLLLARRPPGADALAHFTSTF